MTTVNTPTDPREVRMLQECVTQATGKIDAPNSELRNLLPAAKMKAIATNATLLFNNQRLVEMSAYTASGGNPGLAVIRAPVTSTLVVAFIKQDRKDKNQMGQGAAARFAELPPATAQARRNEVAASFQSMRAPAPAQARPPVPAMIAPPAATLPSPAVAAPSAAASSQNP
ncbi:hypothetical protein T484DRAFT_1922827 [Baffinella frigidus]|nr:hypothetical protein T484DRAFT_1922827 [Cryptophyta sp. CCMP2293]